MENGELDYEVKPMHVLVPRDTKPWAGKLVQAVRHVGFRAFVTIVIGGAMVAGVAQWGHHSAEPKPFWPYFLEHFFTELAIALFISAIVVFMFEWGSEVKHSLDLAGNLANTMTKHITRILNASAAESIAEAMRQLVGKKNAKDFVEPLRSFAVSINKLGGGGGWAGQSYLKFMAWYHGEITEYAESLAILSEKLTADRKSKAEFRLVLPEATVPINVMLARITDEMGSCGTYFAISDIFTWTKLSEFQTAQEKALANGLQIRRIFIIGKPSDAGVTAKEVSLQMFRHYEDMIGSSERYRIKMISQEDFGRLAAPILKTTEHFGIFKPSDDHDHPIIVQVLDERLLTFRISGATEASAVLIAFIELWHDLAHIHQFITEDPVIPDKRQSDHEEDYTASSCDSPVTDDPEGTSDRQPVPERDEAAKSGNSPVTDDPGGTSDRQPTQEGDKTAKSGDTLRPSGKEIIRDHVLSYRMRQLPRSTMDGVWYHGASDIQLWAKGAFREFEQSIIEAAEDGIAIERLFTFKKPLEYDEKSKVFRTLKKHAEISRRKPNYQWRVILNEEMPPELQDEPVALFCDGPKAEVEVARGDANFHIGVPKALAVELEEGFEEAWNNFRRPTAHPFDEVTVLRHFNAEWRRKLPTNPLKKYLENAEARLYGELKESIRKVFGENAHNVLDFIAASSPERTDHDDDPHDHE